MSGIAEFLSNRLKGTPAFGPVSNAYRLLFGRPETGQAKAMRRFYAQFIRPGDLVFDVGANVGDYATAFADVGARVVALDPNPECADSLRKLARMRDVEVVLCAAGDHPGAAQMTTCQFSYFATMNDEFPERTKDSPDYAEVEWHRPIEVPVVTLDQLAERYGTPAFVKIDVEGFEDKVVGGMSFRPTALSFEFTTVGLDIALRVLSALDDYEFNAISGDTLVLVHSRWLTRDELMTWLRQYDETPWGDVFARRLTAEPAPRRPRD
jgi:FkbM family methyltransferase